MAEPPANAQDFAAWTAAQWGALVPDVDSSSATVAIRYIRVAKALSLSHARAIRPWKDSGVTSIDDFRTLGLLRHVGATGIRTQHVADHLDAEPGTVSSRIARLEKHNLIERIDDPSDRRAHLVRLAPGTEQLVDDIYRALVANHEHFFARLSAKEHADLAELLGRLG